MNYTIFKRGGYALNTIGITGGETSGSIFLSRDPIGALEAVTKNYADSSLYTINAGSFTSGLVPIRALPAFAGDITKDAGKDFIKLTPTGVGPGAYTKVSVDSKGRVTAGGSLVESDIPTIPFSKVSAGKPTTLAGYGILDALPNSGGILTGKLSVSEVGEGPYAILNKAYVDGFFEDLGQGVIVGGIIYKATAGPHEGYLMCNGALVNKASYAALFAVMGERYAQFLHNGSGKPWVFQHNINFEETITINSWFKSGVLPEACTGGKVFVSHNRIHLLGGRTASVVRNTVRTAIINSDSSLGIWTAGTAMPRLRFEGEVVVTNNRVYYIGGCEVVARTPTNTVYHSVINSDGTLAVWAAAAALPVNLSDCSVITTRNKMFVIGGRTTTTPVASIYVSTINETTGITGTWTIAGNLPYGIMGHTATVIGQYVYLFGGTIATGPSSVILRAPIDANGDIGSWVEIGNLPAAVSNFELIVNRHKVFVLGKHDTVDNVNFFMESDINPDGTLGVWSFGSEVPVGITSGALTTTKEALYVLGGDDASSVPSADIYKSVFKGRKNSYSDEYGSNYSSPLTDTTKFQLPEVTTEIYGTYAFIKY